MNSTEESADSLHIQQNCSTQSNGLNEQQLYQMQTHPMQQESMPMQYDYDGPILQITPNIPATMPPSDPLLSQIPFGSLLSPSLNPLNLMNLNETDSPSFNALHFHLHSPLQTPMPNLRTLLHHDHDDEDDPFSLCDNNHLYDSSSYDHQHVVIDHNNNLSIPHIPHIPHSNNYIPPNHIPPISNPLISDISHISTFSYYPIEATQFYNIQNNQNNQNNSSVIPSPTIPPLLPDNISNNNNNNNNNNDHTIIYNNDHNNNNINNNTTILSIPQLLPEIQGPSTENVSDITTKLPTLPPLNFNGNNRVFSIMSLLSPDQSIESLQSDTTNTINAVNINNNISTTTTNTTTTTATATSPSQTSSTENMSSVPSLAAYIGYNTRSKTTITNGYQLRNTKKDKPIKTEPIKEKKKLTKPKTTTKNIKKQKSVKKGKKNEGVQPATTVQEERRRIKNPKTRRKHTAIACVRCWKAKTRCGIKRPCDRCVRIGYEDCVDRPSSSRRRQNVNPKEKKTKSNKKTKAKPRKTRIKKEKDFEPLDIPKPTQPQKPKPPKFTGCSTEKTSKFWSVPTRSLSDIMSGYKNQQIPKQSDVSPINAPSTSNILQSRSLPINYQYIHAFPSNMVKLFEKPILSELSADNSFKYLPVLSRYQISTQKYCESCYGLLNWDNKHLHLRTPHNYPCPNKDCGRQFVQQSHLSIHLKICSDSQKLIQDVKGMHEKQFEEIINFIIKAPTNDYYEYRKDVNPTKQWLDEQMKWKKIKKKNKKKGGITTNTMISSSESELSETSIKHDGYNNNNNNNKKKRAFSELTISGFSDFKDNVNTKNVDQTDIGQNEEEEIYEPMVKRRKINNKNKN